MSIETIATCIVQKNKNISYPIIDDKYDISNFTFSNKPTNEDKTPTKSNMKTIITNEDATKGTSLLQAVIESTKHSAFYRYPVNIYIKEKAKGTAFISKEILSILLTAVENVDKNFGIGPIDLEKKNGFIITTNDDIPNDAKMIHHFVEFPAILKNYFQMRVYFHTNIGFKELKNDPTFSNKMRDENVTMKINKLATTTPTKIGFFSSMIPRNEFLFIAEKRIKNKLHGDAPNFQLVTDTIYLSSNQANVVMLLADPVHSEKLKNILKNTKTEAPFFAWHDYLGLQPDQKRTIIIEQSNYVLHHRSLFIGGFSDTNPTLWPTPINNLKKPEDLMDHDSTETKNDIDTWDKVNWDSRLEREDDINQAPDKEYQTTSVSTFIEKHFIAGDRTLLFEKVYPPTLGAIEVVIKPHHKGEALSLFKVLHGELARIMHTTSIESAFIDPDKALIQAADDYSWTPNLLASNISATTTTKSTTTNTNAIRKRKIQKESNNYQSTYAAICDPTIVQESTTVKNKSSHKAINTTPTIMSAQSTLTQQTKTIEATHPKVWEELRKLQLQTTEFKQQHDSITTKIDNFTNETKTSITNINKSNNMFHQKYEEKLVNIQQSHEESEGKIFSTFTIYQQNVAKEMHELKAMAFNQLQSCNQTNNSSVNLQHKVSLLLERFSMEDDNANKRKQHEDNKENPTNNNNKSSSDSMMDLGESNDNFQTKGVLTNSSSCGKNDNKPTAEES